MLTRKAQVATEFFLYTSVFMLVAVAAFIVVGEMSRTEIPLNQNRVVKSTGDGFANVITMSVKAGEGFSYNYTFPKTVLGRPYRVYYVSEGDADVLLIEWTGDYGEFTYAYTLPSYGYSVDSPCLSATESYIQSNNCSNTLLLHNDGSMVTMVQPG